MSLMLASFKALLAAAVGPAGVTSGGAILTVAAKIATLSVAVPVLLPVAGIVAVTAIVAANKDNDNKG